MWTVLKICKLFECNIVQLFALAGFDILETEIKTWTKFYKSLLNLSDEEVEKLKELAKHSPPPNNSNSLQGTVILNPKTYLFNGFNLLCLFP